MPLGHHKMAPFSIVFSVFDLFFYVLVFFRFYDFFRPMFVAFWKGPCAANTVHSSKNACVSHSEKSYFPPPF